MTLLKGTLDALVLKALSFGPRHAFEIIRWIEDGSQGQLELEAAAVLQALHRLEGRGSLAASWSLTENNRRAKYYELTREGRAHLRSETVSLKAAVGTLVSILDAAPKGARG